MLPNLKCGGVVVNEFRAMRGRKRGILCERDQVFESRFLPWRVRKPSVPLDVVAASTASVTNGDDT
jgi:hypothetical protein